MTQSSSSTGMFRTFLKWGGIVLLLVAAIWTAVIIWWQTTHRLISLSDVLIYLVAFPLLLLVCLGTVQIIRLGRRKRAGEPDGLHSGATAGSGTKEVDQDSNEKKMTLPIVAVWAVTSLGSNADGFSKALTEKRNRPRPDMLLLDARGFPLPSGRVMELTTNVIQPYLTRIVSKNGLANVPDTDEWREAFLRTISLLDQTIDQVINEWPLEFESMDDVSAREPVRTLRGASPIHHSQNTPLKLHVKLLISADFKPYEKQLALAYLFEKISTFSIQKEQVQIEIVAATDDATALAVMDKFNIETNRSDAAEALLLLASDSSLCPTVVDNWQSAGRLFSTHCPNGLMMGEAAFGVLCLSNKALRYAAIDPKCRLTRMYSEKRESSADLPGRPSYICLTDAVNHALASAEISGEHIGSVACDADHRTNRTLECIGAMMNTTPHLDAIDNRLAANEACGHIGAASVLGAVVAGVMQVDNAGHPVLLFNVSHWADRTAAILLPDDGILQPS